MAGLEGQRLGGCLLVQLIGHGGVGEVYLAEQPELGRQVAVKVIPHQLDPSASAADAARVSAAFAQEARLIASLTHPNILPIFGFGSQDGLDYLIMPYLPDGSLADLIGPGPRHRFDLPLPPVSVAGLVAQVASALQTAHDHLPAITHGDVKPQNLLARLLPVNPNLTPGMTPGIFPGAHAQIHLQLADFGLARVAGDTSAPRTTGTPRYASPEQYTGQMVPQSDQYALACVAYELLTGQPVFDGDPAALYQQHSFVSPVPPRQRNPLLPPEVDPVLLRALAKAPAQRYARVEEFAQALRAALDPAGMAASQGLGGWPGGVARPAPSPTLPPPGLPAGMVPGPVGAPPPLPPPPPPPPAFSSPLASPPAPPVASAPAYARLDAPGAPIPHDRRAVWRWIKLGGAAAAALLVLVTLLGIGIHTYQAGAWPFVRSATPVAAACGQATSDAFEDTTLNARWTRVNLYPNASALATYAITPGQLRLTAPPDVDLFTSTNFDAPRILQTANGNFTIETTVELNPSAEQFMPNHYDAFQGAGLLIWQDESTFVRLEQGDFDNQHQVGLLAFNGNVATSVNVSTQDTPITLMLQRHGDAITAWWTGSNGAKHQIGSARVHFSRTAVGLALVNNSHEGANVTDSATFSNFTFTCG